MFDQNQEPINQSSEELDNKLNNEQILNQGENQIVEANLNAPNKEESNQIRGETLESLSFNMEQSLKPIEQPIANELDAFSAQDHIVENSGDFQQQEFLGSPESPARFLKKRLLIIIAIILGAILISGGLLFAAGRFFNIKIPFISKILRNKTATDENFANNQIAATTAESPEEIIQKMFSNFRNIKTSQEKFDIKIVKKNEEREESVSSFLLYGRRDFNNAKNPQLDYTFAINHPGVNIDLSLAFKYINETAYIKLMKDSHVPFFDVSELQNQWFYLGKQERANIQQNNSNFFTLKLNKEDWSEIFKFLNEIKLFKTIQPLSDDVIDSTSVFHYSVAINTQNVAEFITKLENFFQNKFNDQNLQIELSREKIDKLKSLLDEIKDAPVEIWIEKESYFFRKALIDHFEIDTIQSDEASKTDISLFIELNRVNEPVYIESPEDGASLEQVIQNLFLKWFNKNSLSNNGGNDDDKDGLTNKEELLYKTDHLNPDTDGDGYIDGDEVKNGYNPNGAGRL